MKNNFRDHHTLSFFEHSGQGKQPVDLALSNYFKTNKSLGAADRRAIGETIFGMIRWKSLIDFFTASQDPAIRLRCFQSIDWKHVANRLEIPESARLGTSEFLLRELCACFGDERGRTLCQTLNEQAPLTIRANLLKTNRDRLMAAWKERFSLTPCSLASQGLNFLKREPLFSLPEFKEGLFEVQDEGSQLVADLVQAQPGDQVLDFCSGSGGKTLAFAPKMEGKGQIFLHDIRKQSLFEARRRLRRAGVQNAQCLAPDHPQLKRLHKKCDWVLVDAPCSGTGTLRRNPEQKWSIDAAMIERLKSQQAEIFETALQYVKPAGRIVYATCSILRQENEAQTDHFLSQFSLELDAPALSLLPTPGGADGFYAAVFRKKKL